jgi:C1A family cysteine protease/phosphodiesterase/alkaline phosphatase D-like protein
LHAACGERHAKFRFGTIAAILAIFMGVACTMPAQEATDTPTLAPLNPRFVEHQDALAHGRVAVLPITPEGHTLGLKPSPMDFSHLIGQTGLADQVSGSLPSSYDLRTYSKVSPVKDQLACGDCWAFATYGSMESALLTSESWNFSENNLNNLSGFDYGVCMGGNGQMSTAYLARWAGPIKATDDPDPTSCTSEATCYMTSPQNLTPQKHVQNVIFIAARANSTDNANLKSAIMTYGGVDVSISADELGWTNPYWNAAHSAYYYNGAAACSGAVCSVDHDITLVGWDDNYSASNFTTIPPGNGAFLVKNSWGTGFGSSGFFWISYYDTKLAIEQSYAFVGNENTTNYTTEYQYDPLGLVNSSGYGTTTAWAANIFTASTNGKLAAVATYALASNATYTIEIYTNASGGPISGTLANTTTGTFNYTGYNTVTLSSPVAITAGQKFSVVVKLTTPGYNYPVPVEYAVSGYSSKATASAGQSYMSPDGNSWTDVTTSSATRNIALKAFANDQTGTSATTGAASAITTTSATLAGTVTPYGVDTQAWFLYGTSSTLSGASLTASQDLGSGTTGAAISANLTGLIPGTKYYYQVVAQNTTGTTNGAISSFTTTAAQSPTATTGSASVITVNSAMLGGAVNPNGADTSYWFLYGTSSTLSGASQTRPQDLGSGTTSTTVSMSLAGLTPGTKYYYQVVAQNSTGTTNGVISSFTTTALQAPTISTSWTATVTVNSAALAGSVNPNGADTNVWFLYGTSSTLSGASQTTQQDLGSGTNSVASSANLTGLTAGTKYYYQVVAKNSVGTSNGSINTFTTTALQAPTVTTGSATAVTYNTAAVAGTVNPNGADTHGWFLYGTSSTLTGAGQTTSVDLGSGTSAAAASANLTGLAASTKYYYGVVAQNATGTSNGTISSFTTVAAPQLPTATTSSASSVTGTSATLIGSVNPNGNDTHGWFLYGTSSTLAGASQTTSQDLGSGTTAAALTASLTGLAPGTQYYFQAVAQNAAGTTNGTINSFNTAAPAPGFSISGTVVTVARGAATGNASTITVTPIGGFTGSVVLTAAVTSSPTGALNLPTFSFGSTSPVPITDSTAKTGTLTISTTPATTGALSYPKHSPVPWYAAGGATLACILLFGIPARRRGWRAMLGMVLLVTLSAGVLSCGGGGGGGAGITPTPTPTKITPAVTVSPSSSSITMSQGLTVTVAVSGGTGNATPTGSVTLSSGTYSSAATTLASGGYG